MQSRRSPSALKFHNKGGVLMYNTVKEIIGMNIGEPVKLKCIVSSKQRLPKKDKSDFIKLTLQDSTGSIVMNVWDNVDTCDSVVNIGDKVEVVGKRGEYDNTPQIEKESVYPLTEEVDISEFVPSYKIPEQLFKYFHNFIKKIKDERYVKILENVLGISTEGEELSITASNKWKDFITAPSAEKHHGNKLGGLFLHTVGVMKAIDNMIRDYIEEPFFCEIKEGDLDIDRLRFLSIMHDYNKIYEYEWDVCIRRKPELTIGHEVLFLQTMSVANYECGNIFTIQELADMHYIILLHHGQWSKYQPGSKAPQSVEAELLHCADMIDSRFVKIAEKQ